MAQVGDVEVPVDGRPGPHLEMIHSQFVLGLFEALFDRPAAERHVQ